MTSIAFVIMLILGLTTLCLIAYCKKLRIQVDSLDNQLKFAEFQLKDAERCWRLKETKLVATQARMTAEYQNLRGKLRELAH